MKEQHAIRASHVIEAVREFVNQRAKSSSFPTRCSSSFTTVPGQKNKYIFAYFKFLLHSGVFKRVDVGFLPVGHKQENIDQAFCKTSNSFHCENTITLLDFDNILQKAFARAAEVAYMRKIVRWFQLCEHSIA